MDVRLLQVFAGAGCGAANCAPLWTATTRGGTPASGLPPAVVVAGGVVYVPDGAGIHAFTAAGCGGTTCPEIVTVPVDSLVSHMTVAGGRLYATTVNNQLIAFGAS